MKASIKPWFGVATCVAMVDRKLSDEYDYAGQLQNKWAAGRKK